jgi:hypothetical protein
MLSGIILAIALTLLVVCHDRLDKRSIDSERYLTEPRVRTRLLGVQIICGNCSGDDARPRRTLLSLLNTCTQCGGNSYVLASNLYLPTALAASRHSKVEEEPTPANPNKVVRTFKEKHAGSPWMM